ncbi:hypothetical protein BDV93DRAFT_523798 [Ceratobasidium sp. AG-I]|nr:hypothetical protein BDV93DRAFT_523798 [Ceratobasidium sp. AG-I]
MTIATSSPIPTIEFIFHGTGTSSSVPNIECLTSDPITCETCALTLTPQGQKNRRRNTGGILRIPGKDEQPAHVIVIDVGKTFLQAAHELFPRYGLRRIDAVILTHPHADAMNGLDDLRGWTLSGRIQSHINIYASAFTFKEVQRSFPYLVAKEFATGGGDIPEFRWHMIKENEPFRVEGLDFDITPISVHHGRIFTDEPTPPGFMPTPSDTPGGSGAASPAQPRNGVPSHSRNGSNESLAPPSLTNTLLSRLSDTSISKTTLSPRPAASTPMLRPYMCFGFVVGDFMVYMSDVSYIPQVAWDVIEKHAKTNDSSQTSAPSNRYKLLVVDCLKIKPHMSHFGIKDAVDTAKRIGANRTYMVGFSDHMPHSDWDTLGERLGGKPLTEGEVERPHVLEALEVVPPPEKEEEGIWIRPAYDGLRIFANKTDVWDATL